MTVMEHNSLASRAAHVECPTCGARDGDPCISKRTHRPVAFNPHPARIDRVREAPAQAVLP